MKRNAHITLLAAAALVAGLVSCKPPKKADAQAPVVEEAAEAVRIAELNFAEGLATGLDVSTAQVALSQAKTNRSQALHDCVVSLAQLDRALGENVDTEDAK